MKKILFVAMMLLVTVTTYSQTVITTTVARIGKWDAVMETWSYGELTPVELTFTASGTGMTVNDESKSVYTFKSVRRRETGKTTDGKATYTAYRWDCEDEKYRDCTLSILSYSTGEKRISIMYNTTVFQYFYK